MSWNLLEPTGLAIGFAFSAVSFRFADSFSFIQLMRPHRAFIARTLSKHVILLSYVNIKRIVYMYVRAKHTVRQGE